jgi:hypothetical protein
MDTKNREENNSQFEFKHAFHTIHGDTDIITAKIIEHTPDGKLIPHFKIIKDFERSAWVTLPQHRKYKDKKTYEPLERLMEIKSTEARMPRALCKALGIRYNSSTYLNQLLSSPYVYGMAPRVTSILKHTIRKKYPEAISPSTIVVGDIETSMLDKDEHILCLAITFKDKVYMAVNRDFVKNVNDPINKLQKAAKEYLNTTIEGRVASYEFVIADSPAQVVIACLQKLHEWKPDFLAFWNMNFDIPRCIKALEDEGYDPKDYFNDPSVPEKYRHTKYYQQRAQKESAGGRMGKKAPSELWHLLENHASWYAIDPMCFFRKNRAHLKQELSYGLDYIGKKLINMGKLEFDIGSQYEVGSKEWHRYMQAKHPIEYCIYCIQDCILVELIDEKTDDLAKTISQSTDMGEYQTMFNLPNALEHAFYFEMLEEYGVVLGQAGQDMRRELDKHIIDTDDIIVMLPSHLITDNGMKLFSDATDIVTQCRPGAADDDVESTYPSSQEVTNLERETIKRELVEIEGMNEGEQKQIGYAIANGIVNSVMICRKLFKYPTIWELDDSIE